MTGGPVPLSPESRNLMATCQGLVRSIAWKIHRRVPKHVDLEDLIGYGQVGLAEAARDFDPSRGHQFTTFAYYRIRGAILDGLSSMAWFNAADYNRGRYEQMADNVLAEHSDEQAPEANDSRWFRSTSRALAVVYLFCHSRSEENSGEAIAVTAPDSDPDSGMAHDELRQELRKAMDVLSDDARSLIQGVYFEGMTIKEAGERIGISKAWASRLHARSLQQLARALGEKQIA